VRTALRHFEKAIAKDPRYALAYCGIADCYIARQSLAASPRESLERAKDAARKALELDDDLAEASVSFARATLYLDWDWPSAERGFCRARDENPGYTETYHAYSHFLIAMGRLEESRAASAQAIALDPRDVSMVAHLGWHYLQAGDFETSIRQTRQALEMDPLYYPSRIHLGMALEQTGAHAEAIAAFRQAADASQSADALAGLAHAVAASGRPKEARRTLEELRVRAATRYVSAFDFAVVHAGLGETDEAVRRLEEAAAQRLPQILELRTDPRLLALRDEPRIVALARRVGLPA
jgi:tetratricopeptide (TPR) repeat protein